MAKSYAEEQREASERRNREFVRTMCQGGCGGSGWSSYRDDLCPTCGGSGRNDIHGSEHEEGA